MKNSRETLDCLKRLDAKAARLSPLAPIVRDFERAWDELAAVRKSRNGTKAAREEKAKPIAERMRANWPLVSLVLRSRQLIDRLRDQVAASEDGIYNFDQAALVDSLWVEIRTLRELVPMAERGESAASGIVKARKRSGEIRTSKAADREAELKQQAEEIRGRNPRMTISDLARMLSERYGLGGTEAIRRKLGRLLNK